MDAKVVSRLEQAYVGTGCGQAREFESDLNYGEDRRVVCRIGTAYSALFFKTPVFRDA